MLKYPFEASYEQVAANFDLFIDAVFESLQSSFLLLPKGPGFVEYRDFQEAYEVLKRHTASFEQIQADTVWEALKEDALSLLVLRSILGFTPPELAYVASVEARIGIPQSFARTLDRRVREDRKLFGRVTGETRQRIAAIVSVTCRLIGAGSPRVPEDIVHRLDKADTRAGSRSLRPLAQTGIPYSMLLYERYLGRPFAGHRDAVSELVGDVMESAVEDQLTKAGVTYRKTRRAERVEGFDQAPDFIVPDEWNPIAIIEAKVTEDDGTARDKVTRIQHLAAISHDRKVGGLQTFEVIACIDGRGFGVRRRDMRKLLEATNGKVFTLKTIQHLVDSTSIGRLRSR